MTFLPHASAEGFKNLMRKIDRLNDELSYVNEKYVRVDQATLEKRTDELFRDFVAFWSNE